MYIGTAKSTPKQYYGKLKAEDYARVLREYRELRRGRLEFQTMASKRGEKFAALLGEHGCYWWHFYDIPLNQHLALLFVLFGWANDLKQIAQKPNPMREFLSFMDTKDDVSDEENPVIKMEPVQQALVLNLLLGLMYSLESMGYYTCSVGELLRKAEKGDPDAFLWALSIDRTVIFTEIGQKLLAQAQLQQKKKFLSGIGARMRAPHSKLGIYVELRLLRRVFEEAGAIGDASMPEIFDLITQKLKIVAPDSVKAMDDLFRLWRQSSTE